MGDYNKKKHNKGYYTNYGNKRPKGKILNPGCKGFILTCNFQEQRALTEAYRILNEAADRLYGAENAVSNEASAAISKENIEDELEEELKSLRDTETKTRRFNQCFTGVKNVLFVLTEVGDPCKIVLSVLEDIKATRIQRSRYLLRLIPVLATCRPFIDNLKTTVSETLDEFLIRHSDYKNEERKVTYAVQFSARNNNKSLKKDEVFEILNDVVKSKHIFWRINLNDPDLILNVDVLGSACCFGILPDYANFKKYNVLELAKPDFTNIPETFEEKVIKADEVLKGDQDVKTNDNEPTVKEKQEETNDNKAIVDEKQEKISEPVKTECKEPHAGFENEEKDVIANNQAGET